MSTTRYRLYNSSLSTRKERAAPSGVPEGSPLVPDEPAADPSVDEEALTSHEEGQPPPSAA